MKVLLLIGVLASSGLGFDGPGLRARFVAEGRVSEWVSVRAEVDATSGEKGCCGDTLSYSGLVVGRFGHPWYGGVGVRLWWQDFLNGNRGNREDSHAVIEAGRRFDRADVWLRYHDGSGPYDQASVIAFGEAALGARWAMQVSGGYTAFDNLATGEKDDAWSASVLAGLRW